MRSNSRQRIRRNNATYELLSLSALNWKLKNDAEFLTEFNQNTCEKLMDTYKFIGLQRHQESKTMTHDFEDPCLTFTVSKRVRMPSVWTAIECKQVHKGAVQEGDVLYFVLRRFKITGMSIQSPKRCVFGLMRQPDSH